MKQLILLHDSYQNEVQDHYNEIVMKNLIDFHIHHIHSSFLLIISHSHSLAFEE